MLRARRRPRGSPGADLELGTCSLAGLAAAGAEWDRDLTTPRTGLGWVAVAAVMAAPALPEGRAAVTGERDTHRCERRTRRGSWWTSSDTSG